jgi:hypothetical protein
MVSSVRDAVLLASGTKQSWKLQARMDVQERENLSVFQQLVYCSAIIIIMLHSNLCTNTEKDISQEEN